MQRLRVRLILIFINTSPLGRCSDCSIFEQLCAATYRGTIDQYPICFSVASKKLTRRGAVILASIPNTDVIRMTLN